MICEGVFKLTIRSTVLFALVLITSGCGIDHYEYPLYRPQSQAYGNSFPLRLAIVYPEEGRSAPDRDEDLEPIVTSRCIELPTYISPRLELSRGLLAELRATHAFQVLHWSPESVDDYDLVVRMKLISGGKRFQSETCPVMLGPSLWEFRILNQQGDELYRQQLVLAKTKIYAKSLVSEFRKDEEIFLGEVVQQVLLAAERLSRNVSDIRNRHALAYIEKRAPELKNMRKQIMADPLNKDLGRAYLLRIGVIEAERMAQDRSTEAVQTIYDQAWADVQEKFRYQLWELGKNGHQALPSKLNLLMTCANSNPGPDLKDARPPEIVYTALKVRNEMIEFVRSPEVAHKLLGATPKNLLPGKLPDLAADAGFDTELRRQLKIALGIGDPGLSNDIKKELLGCAKDTDCKGKRICVERMCVSP